MSSNKTTNEMTRPAIVRCLDAILLVCVPALTILRATYIESPQIDQPGAMVFGSELMSLAISAVLVCSAAAWVLVRLVTHQWRWRKTCLMPAIGLFVAAGVVSYCAASDKRAAMTDWVVLAAPMLGAMLLIQLLTAQRYSRTILLAMIAIGAAAFVQCTDQLADSNEMMIAQYEQDPAAMLAAQGIEPDSLQHWMYEHRLYSKDIRGFLMTSNSTASFFLLAVFAALGLCVEAFTQRKHNETLAAMVCYVLGLLVMVGGLVLTRSKGGIGALVVGLGLFAVLNLLGRRLWKHRVVVGMVLLLAMVTGAGVIIGYGVKHGKLPGGNSLLVRWQYWQGAAAMIADHGLTGVGGGNFGDYYTHYKNAAASETIRNPHCWVLSLLSEYGPLGLAAVCVGAVCVLGRSLRGRFEAIEPAAVQTAEAGKSYWLWMLAAVLVLLLAVRPVLMGYNGGAESSSAASAAFLVLFVIPAGGFVLAFGVLSVTAAGDVSVGKRNDHLTVAMVCGFIAVLVHNLVDFAMFEPGIWGLFWLFAAILIATIDNRNETKTAPAALGSGSRLLGALAVIVGVILFFAWAVVPPARARLLFAGVQSANGLAALEQRLADAIQADPLSSKIAYDAARLFKQMADAQDPMKKDTALNEKAMSYARIAEQRNPADYKVYRLQSDIAMAMAARVGDDQLADCLKTAYDKLLAARDRYPGSDMIEYGLGMIAEQREDYAAALGHFQKAVAIERDYQAQFRVMYPDRDPVVSRLGNTAFTIAKAKIEELHKKVDSQGSRQ